MSAESTTDTAKSALMKVRAQQMVVRGVGAGAVAVAYNTGVNNFPLTIGAHQADVIKTAVSVLAADAIADYSIDGSSWGKALGISIPEVALSEPVIAGVLQYVYERFVHGNPRANIALEFAIGAIASKASDWATKQVASL